MGLINRFSSSPTLILFAVVLVLYGLAFNIYVPPNNGDDITYYHGGLSILAGEGFKEQGKWIVDWPPVQSCLVAAVMGLTGNQEYYVAKIVNGIAVFLSLLLAHRMMLSERRSQPTLSCILIAIFPTALVVGGAGQADFTYFAFSMIFILLVARLKTVRHLTTAVLCGLFLGVASLTRWQGVLLGTCLVFQALEIAFRSPRWNIATILRTIWPEMLASTIGAAAFLSWKLWLERCIANGTGGISNYDYLGSSIWSYPDPIRLFTGVLNLLTQFENVVLTISPTLVWPLAVVVAVFMAVCLWGGILGIKEHGWLATDVFLSVRCCCYQHTPIKNRVI